VDFMSDNNTDKRIAEIFAMARAAGLDNAVAEFPDDVVNAAQAAAQDRDDMPAVKNTERPWPPMRMRSER
jgi:hypothetical protein